MKTENKITSVTRRNIADELLVSQISYSGRMNEPDFLNRIFNLKNLLSRDYRYNNAYDDIYKHMVLNNDWEGDWIFTDSRFDLMHCDDEQFLRFLAETLHPVVRNDENEIIKLKEIYNKNLVADGYEMIQTSEISGKPVFAGQEILIGQGHYVSKKRKLKNILTQTMLIAK